MAVVNIYVGNLPYGTTDQELQDLFSQYGQIAKVSIISDRETGRSRGFGFVEMADDAAGKTAIEALNGQDFGGRPLTVNEARPRAERSSGGGGGGGGPRNGGGSGGGGGGGGGGGYRGGR